MAGRILPGGLPADLTRLTVVLPPELGDLPVEALPVEGEPLIERVVLSYAPCCRPAHEPGEPPVYASTRESPESHTQRTKP